MNPGFGRRRVSEMKKALTSKRRLQTGAESILESISDGVFTVDADWYITSFNRAAEAITGIPKRPSPRT